MFYQCGLIYHFTHVPGPVSQPSAESDYNAACTAATSTSHSRMLNNEFLNKDPDMVLEQATLIIWDSKSDVCVDNNGKYTKHIRHMA